MYVVDSSWLISAYEKSIGKDIGDDFDGYVEFSDKFVDEFTMSNDVELTLERII
jgi:aminopeptidase C